MTVRGVGSRSYFIKRGEAISAIGKIEKEGEEISANIKNKELSLTIILIKIGKAWREFVEFFREGYYQKKLDKRIKALKQPDQYEKNIERFCNRFIKKLKKEAFEGFKGHLKVFYDIVDQLLQEPGVEKDYPELHRYLKIAKGSRKEEVCRVFEHLGSLLDVIDISTPDTKVGQLILDLKAAFISPIQEYLNKNLTALKNGLRISSAPEKALHLSGFLDAKNGELATLVPELGIWKKKMLQQRKNVLEALPGVSSKLKLYSFTLRQITEVEKIVKWQEGEVETRAKLKAAFANHVADRLVEKVKNDKKRLEDIKQGLFSKPENKIKDLLKDKTQADRKLQKKATGEDVKALRMRADEIDKALGINDACLKIFTACFDSWVLPVINMVHTDESKLNKALTKLGHLQLFAHVHKEIFQYPDRVQDAIDTLIAESFFRLLLKECESPQGSSSERLMQGVNKLQKEHLAPLKNKTLSGHHEPHWLECAVDFLNEAQEELEARKLLRKH